MNKTNTNKTLLNIVSKKYAPKKWAKSPLPTTSQLVWNRIFKEMENSQNSSLQKAS